MGNLSAVAWLGNLVGSVFVAMLYSGGGSLLPVDTSIVHSVALAKTTAPAMVLFFKRRIA